MDLFPMETLDETPGLSSEETLEALASCSDPSILSIFEDVPTLETKGLDEDSEAMLLTALTEILDNVDDENLSPFDTLPDSDLLSNQKGREHSPLRRLLCLSRSPQEKETFFSTRPSSAGKSLFRTQADSVQRSDGEEEEDGSFTLSSVSRGSSPDSDLLDWDGLTLPLPLTFEQEGEDDLSVSLGDLVRHMHPYCIPVSVENEDGEHMLPEGGILLEVVDQGENGEPILAVPNISLSVSEPLEELPAQNETKVSDEAEEESSDSSEHIVVDDEDDAPVNKNDVVATVTPVRNLDVKEDVVIKRQKENKIRSPSRRKKKKKCKEVHQPLVKEERVLRSGTVRKTAQELQKKPERRSVKEKKKQKVLNVPHTLALNPEEMKPCKTQIENTTTAQLSEMNEKAAAPLPPQQDTVLSSPPSERGQPTCSTSAISSQQSCETPKQPIMAPVEVQSSPTVSSFPLSLVPSESPAAALSSGIHAIPPPVSASQPFPEPKPKSLSLEEYRRLRQLKKPAPMEKQEKNSVKWPTLPELPKELPPIPCLPDPTPKDPRRPSAQVTKKEVEEVKPAWQPRGPGAPPTPEALLVPPAYMIASSNKVASAAPVPKPQQTTNSSKLPEKPPTPPSNSEKNVASHSQTTTKPTVPCVPQSFVSSGSSKPCNITCSADGKHPSVSGRKGEENELQQSQPVPPKHTKISTTDVTKSTSASGSALSVPQNSTVVSQKLSEVTASTSFNKPVTCDIKSSKPTASSVKPPTAAFHLDSCSPTTRAAVLETKEKPTTQRAKSSTQELIETFTSEIGIEAADLTSLLEQFEETQVKEKQCVAEVCGRAAAVGNSRPELVPEKTVVERVRAHDLSTSAALTPPATPPHQMWKPLATVSLLGKNKSAETSRLAPSKIIQIEAQPLPSVRSRGKPTPSTIAAASVASDLVCMDHDYCLPSKGTSTEEPGKRWNVKQQSLITIKPIKQDPPTIRQTPRVAVTPASNPVVSTKTQNPSHTDPSGKRTFDKLEECSVLETPDASPIRQESESSFKARSPRRGPIERSYRRHAASPTPSPRCSPTKRIRGRSRKRKCHRSPSHSSSCSDSCSSRSRSRSFSPARKRYRSRNSGSSSSSSSRSSSRSSPSLSRSPPRRRRYSYSSSRSGSWSRSRSRSQSPESQWSGSRRLYSPSYRPKYNDTKRNMEELKRRKEKAIEERRVVYVGRIRGTMTQKELKERFSLFGEIEECTLHFRDHGDNYGFVTYYDTKDAFTAIENGNKLRKPDELPFDLCFGGRRQFCQTGYADLDSNREYDPYPTKGKFHALDFDTLLKQAQQNLKR